MGMWIGECYEAMNASAIKKSDPQKEIKTQRLMSNPNYIGQRKLNGERILACKYNGKVILLGRNTSKKGLRMEKTGLLPHIIRELEELLPYDGIFDGEILAIPHQEDLSLDEIKAMSFKEDFWMCRDIMGHHLYPKEGVAQQEINGKLHYFVFDVLAFQEKEIIDCAYADRLQILNMVDDTYFKSMQYIHKVPVVYTATEKQALLDYCLGVGLEGIILKQLSAMYKPGKRPANVWVKVKRSDPADCIIIGYSEAEQWTETVQDGKKCLDDEGNVVLAESRFYANGWIGAMWLGQWSLRPPTRKQTQNARAFYYQIIEQEYGGVTRWLVPVAKVSGMDDNLREKISNNRSAFMGKICVINYFEQTKDAYFQPTFSHFRDDKSTLDCSWDYEEKGADIEDVVIN